MTPPILLQAHPEFRAYLPGSDTCPLLLTPQQSIGGHLSTQATHFMVHEVPLYLPSQSGEHLFALMLKNNLSTTEAIKILADEHGIKSKDISFAGRKDKYALTTQWISTQQVTSLHSEHENVQILYQAHHTNKLKLGHLCANLFSIYLSDIQYPQRLDHSLSLLSQGVPNYFGRQRFGRVWYESKRTDEDEILYNDQGHKIQDPTNWASDNVDRALQVLKQNEKNKKGRGNKTNKKLLLSALQSALFNLWLGERIRDGLLHQVILGDVCRKKTGGTFYSTDPQEDTRRLQAGEIEILGPLFGPKIFPSHAHAAEREQELYKRWGMEESLMKSMAKFWKGDRRSATLSPIALRANLVSLMTTPTQTKSSYGVWLHFMLPKGAYATTICTELLQTGHPFIRQDVSSHSI